MDDRQQREAAKQFSEYWKEKGYEKVKVSLFGSLYYEMCMVWITPNSS